MRALLYTGSSVTKDDLRTIDTSIFEVRNPIRRGDLPSAVREGYRLVAIIDGEFMQSFAVSPKEVLAALQAGVVLVGGASMGALRAAELHPYGMHGVGQVFRWYKSGRVKRDDDVAIVYAEGADGYRVHTTPMVNVFWTMDQAKQARWLPPDTCRRVVMAARRIYWAERTWRGICAAAKVTPEERARLLAYTSNVDHDLKRLDALAVIKYTAELLTANN